MAVITGTNYGNELIGNKYTDNKLYGKDGNDVITGGIETDYIDGDNGSDKLYGGSGNDTIKAGTDKSKNGIYYENFIDGGEGDDKLYAGGGKNTFHFGENSGNDIIYSANSDDMLTFDSTYNFGEFKFDKDGNNLIINTGYNSSVELSNYFKSKDGNVVDKMIVGGIEYSIVDNLYFDIDGTDKKDTIVSNISTNTITAGLGDDYMVYFSSKTNLEIEDHGGVDTLNITMDSMSSLSNDDICFCFDIRRNGTFAGEPNAETDRMYIFSKDTLTYDNVMREIRGKDMQGVIEIENFLKVNARYDSEDFLGYGAIENICVGMDNWESMNVSGSIQEIASNVVSWLNSSNNTLGWDSSMEVFASGNKEAIESLISAFNGDWTAQV